VCIPRGEHIVMIGDSTMRYQYLSLVYALKYGAENVLDFPHQTITCEKTYADWPTFFRATNKLLQPNELCDCCRGANAKLGVERRYFHYDGVSVTYQEWMATAWTHGRWWPNETISAEKPRICEHSQLRNTAQDGGWGRLTSGHQWLVDILQVLEPTAVVLNQGHGLLKWPYTGPLHGEKFFGDLYRQIARLAPQVMWRSTHNDIEKQTQRDRPAAEAAGFPVFDAHAITSEFARKEWWKFARQRGADRLHLKSRGNNELNVRLLQQLFPHRHQPRFEHQPSLERDTAMAKMVARAAVAAYGEVDHRDARLNTSHAAFDAAIRAVEANASCQRHTSPPQNAEEPIRTKLPVPPTAKSARRRR
jgi:hypothetical protein